MKPPATPSWPKELSPQQYRTPPAVRPQLCRSLPVERLAKVWPPVTATGTLSGLFDWTCTNGRISGRVLLAPTTPWSIQALNFRYVPTAP